MAALTKARNTLRMGPGDVVLGSIDAPLKAAATVWQGGMVALELSSGFYVPATATLGLMVVGRFNSEHSVTPSLTAGAANGSATARVEQGIFRYNNSSSTDAITVTELGDICYVVDDNTVARTDAAGTRPAAGRVMGVDSAGVYVQLGLQLTSPDDIVRGSPEQIAASGALTVGKRTTVLAVSGTKAYPLPDGLYTGQRKTIFCKSAVSTPVGVVTPAHLAGFVTITFGAANTAVELEFNGTNWDIVGVSGVVTIA